MKKLTYEVFTDRTNGESFFTVSDEAGVTVWESFDYCDEALAESHAKSLVEQLGGTLPITPLVMVQGEGAPQYVMPGFETPDSQMMLC